MEIKLVWGWVIQQSNTCEIQSQESNSVYSAHPPPIPIRHFPDIHCFLRFCLSLALHLWSIILSLSAVQTESKNTLKHPLANLSAQKEPGGFWQWLAHHLFQTKEWTSIFFPCPGILINNKIKWQTASKVWSAWEHRRFWLTWIYTGRTDFLTDKDLAKLNFLGILRIS